MYEFHYDYIKDKIWQTNNIIHETDSLTYKIKRYDAYEDFSSEKEVFAFSSYLTKSKCCENLDKLVLGKMKNETVDIVTEECVRLNAKK